MNWPQDLTTWLHGVGWLALLLLVVLAFLIWLSGRPVPPTATEWPDRPRRGDDDPVDAMLHRRKDDRC